jgi:ABC-2 type transport system permease protein
VRGVGVGIVVLIVSLLFAKISIVHIGIVILFLILTSIVFSLAGLVNGIYAKGFDAITIVPTFVLTPLVYLGGVFYSSAVLPDFWKIFTHLNPIFYIINGFRYGFIGFSDVSLATSIYVLLGLAAVLVGINWYLIRTGLGLKQ